MQGHSLEEFYPAASPAYALASAAARGDSVQVETLVRAGADPNAVGRRGMQPLVWALGAKNVVGVRALLAAGADPNRRPSPAQAAVGAGGPADALDISPMALVTGAPDTSWLALLLAHGGDPNGPDQRGEPLLFQAIGQSNMAAVRLLTEHGADVNRRGVGSETPAMAAAALNQYVIVRYLLEHGADWREKTAGGSWLPVRVQNARIGPEFVETVEAYRWVRDFLEQHGVHFPVEEPWQRREREERAAASGGRPSL